MSNIIRTFLYLILLFSIGIGIYFRLVDLGKWSLAVDEYFLTQSIFNILERNIPVFGCGGYYFRGLLQQYTTAFILIFSEDIEWAVRIFPAVANLFTIPAVYIIGKRLGGNVIACTATALFCLSIWEIEYARFARMYAPFQMLFLWQLVLLIKVLDNKATLSICWMYAIAALGLIVYEGAIFLTVLCILPLLIKSQYQNIKNIFAIFSLLIINIICQTTHFRHLNAQPHMPTGIVPADTGIVQQVARTAPDLPIWLPDVFLLSTLPNNAYWLYTALILFIISLYALWQLIRTQPLGLIEIICWLFLFLCSFLNLYGLLITSAIICLMIGFIEIEKFKKNRTYHTCMVAFTVNGIFWLSYGIATEDWANRFSGEDYNKYYKLFVVLLKYPDIYTSFLYQWLSAMPWLTILMFACIALGFLSLIAKSEKPSAFSFLIAAMIICIMIIGIVKTPYYATRYTFFIYPVAILLFCTSLFRLTSFFTVNYNIKIISYLFALIVFALVSEDFQFYHLKNISTKEINFRQIYSPHRTEVYYRRQDFATPASYINDNKGENDLVIATFSVVPFYLNHLDYRFVDHKISEFPAVSSCFGSKEVWSNATLLYKENELFKIIDNSSYPVWVLMQAEEFFDLTKRFEKNYQLRPHYRSLDGNVLVYRVPGNS